MLLKLRLSDVINADDECIGFCVDCGCDSEGCEPDLCRGKCPSCGQHQLYGIQQIMLNDWVEILVDDDSD